MSRRIRTCLAVLPFLVGCGTDASDRMAAAPVGPGVGDLCAPGAVVPWPTGRDSAGVVTIESEHPLWAEGEGWSVGAEPALRISDDRLWQIFSGFVADDGSFVLASIGSREVLFYERDGSFREAFGGQGASAEEFLFLQSVHRADEGGVIAIDLFRPAVKLLRSDGSFVESVNLTGLPGRVEQVVWMGNDGLVLRTSSPIGRIGSGPAVTIARAPTRLLRTRLSDQRAPEVPAVDLIVEPFVEILGTEQFVWQNPNGGGTSGALLFGRRTTVARGGSCIVVGTADFPGVELYDPEGALRGVLRAVGGPSTLPQMVWDNEVERRLEAFTEPEVRASRRQMYADLTKPEFYPAYSELVVDRSGNLWLGAFRSTGERTTRWTVFRSDGVWLGDVEMPNPLQRILEIGEDYILGVEVDAFDVESVVVLPLGRDL